MYFCWDDPCDMNYILARKIQRIIFLYLTNFLGDIVRGGGWRGCGDGGGRGA